MNPPPKTLFQQKLADLEEAVYSSKCKAPLGRSHDQSRGLPLAINPMEHKFGLKTVKGGETVQTVILNCVSCQDYSYVCLCGKKRTIELINFLKINCGN